MNFRQQVTPILIALGAVFALGYGALLFLSALIDKLNSISGDLSKALVAGGIAIVTAVVTLVVGKVWEQKVKIRQEIREKKIPVYEEQIQTFFSAMFAAKFGGVQANEEELGKAFVSFSQKLVIWGGPDVIKAWCSFRSHDWQASTPMQSFATLETFIKAIRNELGNDSSSLTNGELLKLFINDYDAHKAKIEAEQSGQPEPPITSVLKS
jgi:hypothetical protein